jgi:hypothetical protein
MTFLILNAPGMERMESDNAFGAGIKAARHASSWGIIRLRGSGGGE